MAGSVKKESAKLKAAAKPRKAEANTNGAPNGAAPGFTNGTASKVTQMPIPREQVAQLAHRFWTERGGGHGHHEEDWFRAERELRELRGKAS